MSFPASPVLNQTVLLNNRLWQYNGTAWEAAQPDTHWLSVIGKPATFAPSAHTHDDRYYTETEIDTALAGKQNALSYPTTALPWKGIPGQQAFDTTIGAPVYFSNGSWKKFNDNSIVANRVVDIFILAGQSNAHGHAQITGLTTPQKTQTGLFFTSWHNDTSNAETTQYYSGLSEQLVAGSTRGDAGVSTLGGSLYFGPELGFVNRANAINLTGNIIGVLKYAVGASTLNAGTANSDWDTTATGSQEGDCWRGLKAAIANCVSKLNAAGYVYNFKGLIWWQGESGATVTGLQAFIAALRSHLATTYGLADSSRFPVVITKIGYGNDLTPVDLADPYVGSVDAAVYGHSGTNNHIGTSTLPDFNGNGINDMFDIGVAYADQMSLAIAGTTAGNWEPNSSNVSIWADASQLSGAVGSSVTTLADRKAGNPAWNVVGTGVTIAQQNFRNVVDFSSTAVNYFEQAANMSISTGRQVWYIVAKPTTVNNGQDSLWSQVGGSSITFLPSSSTGFLGKAYHSNKVCSNANISASNLVGDFHLIAVDWDVPSNLIFNYLNGTLVETYNPATAATPWTLTMSGTAHKQRLFAQYAGTPASVVLDGYFAEALISNVPSDHEKIEGYLAHKWGISSKLPVSHPYKTTAP